MGELINFMEYWEAKQHGISVKEWRAADKKVEDFLKNPKAYEPIDHFGEYMVQDSEEYDWPAGYQYVLQEDIDTGYHDDCEHKQWEIVEEGFQATCKSCDLNAWSAPW